MTHNVSVNGKSGKTQLSRLMCQLSVRFTVIPTLVLRYEFSRLAVFAKAISVAGERSGRPFSSVPKGCKTQFNVSLGYLDQNGIIKPAKKDDFRRYNAAARVSVMLSVWRFALVDSRLMWSMPEPSAGSCCRRRYLAGHFDNRHRFRRTLV